MILKRILFYAFFIHTIQNCVAFYGFPILFFIKLQKCHYTRVNKFIADTFIVADKDPSRLMVYLYDYGYVQMAVKTWSYYDVIILDTKTAEIFEKTLQSLHDNNANSPGHDEKMIVALMRSIIFHECGHLVNDKNKDFIKNSLNAFFSTAKNTSFLYTFFLMINVDVKKMPRMLVLFFVACHFAVTIHRVSQEQESKADDFAIKKLQKGFDDNNLSYEELCLSLLITANMHKEEYEKEVLFLKKKSFFNRLLQKIKMFFLETHPCSYTRYEKFNEAFCSLKRVDSQIRYFLENRSG